MQGDRAGVQAERGQGYRETGGRGTEARGLAGKTHVNKGGVASGVRRESHSQ